MKQNFEKALEFVKELKQIPFGLVLARGGKHAAVISYGEVYEVHLEREPLDKELIDVKDFKTQWPWLSGVIMVPPDNWKTQE